MKGFWSIFVKIIIPAVIIYIIVLLTFQSCSSDVMSEETVYNRNCFTPADVLPPANGGQEEPTGAPNWNYVHRAKEFWTAVHSRPKNIILFGTYYCTWCRATEKWWNENGTVDGWQFVDWNLLKSDSDEAQEEFIKTLENVYFSRNPKNSKVGFPTCAALVNAQPGKPLAETVLYVGLGFDECAQMLKDFVLSVK